MTNVYMSSKGPRQIDEPPYPYLANALAKLQREQTDGERQDEIGAMAARLAEIDAMAEEPQQAETL
jgi:hypothetical protein